MKQSATMCETTIVATGKAIEKIEKRKVNGAEQESKGRSGITPLPTFERFMNIRVVTALTAE